MKHKIWINILTVILLVPGLWEFLPGEQLAAHTDPADERLNTISGDDLTFVVANYAQEAEGVNVDFVGHIGGSVNDVAVAGEYAYVGDGLALTILDVSTPSSPEVVGRSGFLPDIVQGIEMAGNYAYLADGSGGLRVVDVSDPTNPIEVGSSATPMYAYGVAVVGYYTYIADYWSGLRVIDDHHADGLEIRRLETLDPPAQRIRFG